MKIHMIDKTTSEEKYPNSPHLVKAILNGWFTMCSIIAQYHTTDDINEVTCKACKVTHDSKFEGYTEPELKTAFEKIHNVNDWKKPIFVRVMKKDLDVTLSAIRFYTATSPKITSTPGRPDVYVETKGYRAGPVNGH